jgi:hypothetical protein
MIMLINNFELLVKFCETGYLEVIFPIHVCDLFY